MGGHLVEETPGGYTWTAWVRRGGERVIERGLAATFTEAHSAAEAALAQLSGNRP
jgi:hypothetical protein